MGKSKIIPLALIGVGLIFLLPMLTGGKGGIGGGLFNTHHRITCEVTIHAGLIFGDNIVSKNCVQEKSVTCGVELVKGILTRSGTIKLLMDTGESKVESWTLGRGATSKGVISVCSESTSGKIQLFDDSGNLKDEQIFQTA